MIIDSLPYRYHKPSHLYEDLLLLGDTPYQVLEKLKALGIKGRHGVANDCPVARYLTGNDRSQVLVGGSVAIMHNPWTVVMLPCAVNLFIQRFDDHEFPELIEVEA